MNQKTLILLGIVLCVLGPGQSSGEYSENYTTNDLDDIVVDILAIVAVEFKPDIGPMVDIVVLIFMMGLLTTTLLIIATVIAKLLLKKHLEDLGLGFPQRREYMKRKERAKKQNKKRFQGVR